MEVMYLKGTCQTTWLQTQATKKPSTMTKTRDAEAQYTYPRNMLQQHIHTTDSTWKMPANANSGTIQMQITRSNTNRRRAQMQITRQPKCKLQICFSPNNKNKATQIAQLKLKLKPLGSSNACAQTNKQQINTRTVHRYSEHSFLFALH